MATYKGIKGVKVVTKATDPTASEAEGTVWYNSTSPTALKYAIQGTAAWSAGGALNTARDEGANCGTQSAALFAGGEPPNTNDTEIYNGSTWTEVGNLVSGARYGLEGFGSTTAAIAAGGHPPSAGANYTESWNGNFLDRNRGNMNTPRYNFGSAIGSPSTAGLVMEE